MSRTSIINSHDMVTKLCHGVQGRRGSQSESCWLVSSNVFFQIFYDFTHQSTSLLSIGLKYFSHHLDVLDSLSSRCSIAATQALRRHLRALRSICVSRAPANNDRTTAIPLWKKITCGGHSSLARNITPFISLNFELALGTWAFTCLYHPFEEQHRQPFAAETALT